MASFPTLDPATFQSIVSGITGHDSSGGLIAAVGSLIAGNIATGIISKAVSGGALSVVDPLGLATHLASGGATPAAIAAVPGLAATPQAAPAAPAPKVLTLAQVLALGVTVDQAKASGYIIAG
jgi:hypothetical protein